MILIYWWQVVLYTIFIFVGIAWIVESRIKKSQLTISDFLTSRDSQIRKTIINITDRIVDEVEFVENRVKELENGRDPKEID